MRINYILLSLLILASIGIVSATESVQTVLYDNASANLVDANFYQGSGYFRWNWYDNYYYSYSSLSSGWSSITRKPRLDITGFQVNVSKYYGDYGIAFIIGDGRLTDGPQSQAAVYGYAWTYYGLYYGDGNTVTLVNDTILPIPTEYGVYHNLEMYIDENDTLIGKMDGVTYLTYPNSGGYNSTTTTYTFSASERDVGSHGKLLVNNIYDKRLETTCINIYYDYVLTEDKVKDCIIVRQDNAKILSNGYTLNGTLNMSGYTNLTIDGIVFNGDIISGKEYSYYADGPGGDLYIFRSTINGLITTHSGDSFVYGTPKGGDVYIYDSIINAPINTSSGKDQNGGAGPAGNVLLYNTIHNDNIYVNGVGGHGGDVTISNSTTQNIFSSSSYHSYGNGYGGNVEVSNNSHTGNIFTNGGDSYWGGASGGNIFVISSTVGNLNANGGGGYNPANGGNIYLESSTYGTLSNYGQGSYGGPLTNGTIIKDTCTIDTNSNILWNCTTYNSCIYPSTQTCAVVNNPSGFCTTPYPGDMSEFNRPCVCIENWVANNTACNGLIYTKQYYDATSCGTTTNLPADNNTVIDCSTNNDTQVIGRENGYVGYSYPYGLFIQMGPKAKHLVNITQSLEGTATRIGIFESKCYNPNWCGGSWIMVTNFKAYEGTYPNSPISANYTTTFVNGVANMNDFLLKPNTMYAIMFDNNGAGYNLGYILPPTNFNTHDYQIIAGYRPYDYLGGGNYDYIGGGFNGITSFQTKDACIPNYVAQYPTTCPSNSLWVKTYRDTNNCVVPAYPVPNDNNTLVACTYIPPAYENQTFNGQTTTDLNTVENITAVENFTVASSSSAVQWITPVDLSNVTSISDVITTTSNFISVDINAVPGLNAPAEVSFTPTPKGGSNPCNNFVLYYAVGYYSTAKDLVDHGQIVANGGHVGGDCIDPSICTNVQCTNGVLTFTAQHFDGFGIGEVEASVVQSCQNSRGIIYAGFALVAVLIIAGAAFLILSLFKGGNVDGGTIIAAVVGFIAVGVVIMIGYFIISQMPGMLCG